MQETNFFGMAAIILDDTVQNGVTLRKNVLGGVAYTLAGMRIWDDKIGVCSGIGKDFDEVCGPWFSNNNISLDGTIVKAEKTAHSILNYFENGEREEIAIAGTGSPSLMTLSTNDIPQSYYKSKGMYFFTDFRESTWDNLASFLKTNPMVCVWEFFDMAAVPQSLDLLPNYLPIVDIFSLNISEGRSLTQKQDPVEIADTLTKLGAKTLMLRMGKEGSLIAQDGHIWHIPAVPTNVVDVTGGGNSFTGGFLVDWVNSGGNAQKAGVAGAVSSSFIIEQYGNPPLINNELTARANARKAAVQTTKVR